MAVELCCDYCASVVRGKGRLRPNILICGVRGTGKSTLAELLAKRLEMRHIDLTSVIKEEKFHNGHPEGSRDFKVDAIKTCEYLESNMRRGGCICDYHSVHFLPELLFDLIVVLSAEKSYLYPRLKKRGVPHRDADAISSRENQARYLLGVREAFDERSILPLESNDSGAIEKNAVFIAQDLDW